MIVKVHETPMRITEENLGETALASPQVSRWPASEAKVSANTRRLCPAIKVMTSGGVNDMTESPPMLTV